MANSSTRRRVAILGAGMIGELHRRVAVLAGVEVDGVLASTPAHSRVVAADRGAAQALGSIDERPADTRTWVGS
jgi:predicted dehydrogenase